jgi:thioredoxin 1
MNADNSQNIEIGETNFEAEVLRSKQPVAVLFTAPWSKACGVILPIVEEVAKACAGKLKVLRVNVDDHLDLGVWYDIQYIPTLLYFVNGEVCVRLVGTASKEAIISKIEPFLHSVTIKRPLDKHTSAPKDKHEPHR